jgi:hypothetical protein
MRSTTLNTNIISKIFGRKYAEPMIPINSSERYGVSPKQTSLGPQGYFHRQDTEKQMAAYSTQVVSVGRTRNDVNKLQSIPRRLMGIKA